MKTESQRTLAISAGRILAWGGAAALAACLVSIILIGTMPPSMVFVGLIAGPAVGTAIRHASRGRGGRWRQVAAVALAYLAVSASYMPGMAWRNAKNPPAAQARSGRPTQGAQERPSFRGARAAALLMVAVGFTLLGPLLLLISLSGWLAGVILCFALVRTWKLAGAVDAISGPLTDSFE